MPRPKVSEAARRRIAKACLSCQTMKQKCDGECPCATCVRRECAKQCAYSDHIRSYGHRRRRRQPIQKRPPATQPTPDRTDNLIEIAVPKLPQSLYDTKGRVVYLGDCAALAFLQNIQEIIEHETQPSAVASNWQEFEELPPDSDGRGLSYAGDIYDLQQLIQTFFAVTCGILDIIEPSEVEHLLHQWIHGSLDQNRAGEAVLYLILAYAAQAQASCPISNRRAQSFYHHGRRIALLQLTENPSIETVQAFLLISLYMLGGSRRNGAFLNLGIAISAAKALGIHRRETNMSFPDGECHLRARIWATLRYHDFFFCAMMGRTSSTITTDCTVLERRTTTTSPMPKSEQEIALNESAHAFSFMERTVNEIYTKRTVSMGALKIMVQELQEAITHIPSDLRTISIPQSGSPNRPPQHILLRNANILCSYHFSMMLLTRPFLVAKLRAHLNPTSTSPSTSSPCATIPATDLDNQSPEPTMIYTDITRNASSCVRAATETVQLLHHLLTAKALFTNMPLTVAWTFVSALTICSAYFGQLGTAQLNEPTLLQAGQILDYFAISSPQARRYSRILQKLSDVATTYRYSQDTFSSSRPYESSLFPPVDNQTSRSYIGGTAQSGPCENSGIPESSWRFDKSTSAPPSSGDGDSMLDLSLFPLDLANADSIWDINWVGNLL